MWCGQTTGITTVFDFSYKTCDDSDISRELFFCLSSHRIHRLSHYLIAYITLLILLVEVKTTLPGEWYRHLFALYFRFNFVCAVIEHFTYNALMLGLQPSFFSYFQY